MISLFNDVELDNISWPNAVSVAVFVFCTSTFIMLFLFPNSWNAKFSSGLSDFGSRGNDFFKNISSSISFFKIFLPTSVSETRISLPFFEMLMAVFLFNNPRHRLTSSFDSLEAFSTSFKDISLFNELRNLLSGRPDF